MVIAQFALTPIGPFSLASSIRFLEGFTPAAYQGPSTGLDLAFCIDGRWDTVAVHVEQPDGEGGRVLGRVHAPTRLPDAAAEAVTAQLARILSLDVDGTGFPAIGRADPVVGRLQARYPGLRPVCFWSPYEAAAWAVIGQRIPIRRAAVVKARMAAELGITLDVDGREVSAFPAPAVLAGLEGFAGLTEVKVDRLRGIARAALDGRLGAAHLRSLPREQALAELLALPGIGPFSAELTLLRGAGDPDHLPTAEPRLGRAVALAYELPEPPDPAALNARGQVWRPYRTWVTLLLRILLEEETGEIAGRARS
jgi:DNA-3-methyladenine glycosylase II